MPAFENMSSLNDLATLGKEPKCLAFYGGQDTRYDIKPEIKAAFETDRPIIITGETGQGKTTALIKLCFSFATYTSFGKLIPNGYVPMIYISGEHSKNKLSCSNAYIGLADKKAKEELEEASYKMHEKTFKFFGSEDLPEDESIDSVLNFVKENAKMIRNKSSWQKKDKTVGVVVDNIETVFQVTTTSQPKMLRFWKKLSRFQNDENIVFIVVVPLKTNGKKKNQPIKPEAIAGAKANAYYCGEIFAVDDGQFYGVKNHYDFCTRIDNGDGSYFLKVNNDDCLFDDPEIRSIKHMKAGDLDALINRKFGERTAKQLRKIREDLLIHGVIKRDENEKTGGKMYRYSGCNCNVQPIIDDEINLL